MNQIKASWDKSDYEIYNDFLNYRIDDYWLDEKLDELYAGNMYKGLIPTLSAAICCEEEKKIVWERILPDENQITLCPILMCPDDNDFSCTLIIAEIKKIENIIYWCRLGKDETENRLGNNFGKKIKWLDNFKQLKFSIDDYLNMIEVFKGQMDI